MPLPGEQRFWDLEALGRSRAMLEREARFVAEEPLWGWARQRVAERRPRRLLDLGAGRGATTLSLAGPGLALQAVDLSFEALRAARRLLAAAGHGAALSCARLEALPFASGSFDLVAGRFVLHHAGSLEAAAAEIERVLAPGGAAVFVETWGGNPFLRCAREAAALLGLGIGTADERPLDREAIEILERRFRVSLHFPVFTAFELTDRLWRRLRPLARRSLRARESIGRAWRAAQRADRWVGRRLPGLLPYGWFAGIILEPRARGRG